MRIKLPPHRRMNFIPENLRPSIFGPDSLRLLLVVLALGVPLLAAGARAVHWGAEQSLQSTTREQEALAQRITASVQSRDTSADQLAMSAIRKALSEKLYWADVFKELSNVAPKSIWLNSFDTSVDGGVKKVVISGQGTSQPEIAEFFARLERSYFFRDVQLKYTETSEVTGSAQIRFQFEGKVFDDGKAGRDGPT
jgi:Tfp pilus assembly protein PilN